MKLNPDDFRRARAASDEAWQQDLLLTRAFPWAPSIAKMMMRIAGHVRFESDHIMMFSDYSGQHSSADYETYAFVVIDEESSRSVPSALRAWRREQKLETRTVSFKGLRDARKQDALNPYLSLWNNVTGACVVIAVAKEIGNICTSERARYILRTMNLGGFQLNPRSLEKATRICHFGAILTSMLSRNINIPNLSWLTDDDDIAANDRAIDSLLILFSGISSLYARRMKGTLAINTPSMEPDNQLILEDFLALADLMAGATCEFMNTATDGSGVHEGVWWEGVGSDSLSPKADVLLEWLSARGPRMHRGIIAIDRGPQALRTRLLTP